MSHRQEVILLALRSGPTTSYTLAQSLDCPEASVRRDIQALRRAGHSIGVAEYDGLYRLYGESSLVGTALAAQ